TVGAVRALRPVEGVRLGRARRGDRLPGRRAGKRARPPRRLPAALRPARRVVRAGEGGATERGLRLRHAAHRPVRLDDPRAPRTESHAPALPRDLSHANAGAALVRGADLPLHQPQERGVHAGGGGVADGAPVVSGGSGGSRVSVGGRRRGRVRRFAPRRDGRRASGHMVVLASSRRVAPAPVAALTGAGTIAGSTLARVSATPPLGAGGAQRLGFGVTGEVGAGVGAGGDDLEVVLGGVREGGAGERGGHAGAAERGWCEGVL